jgi:hypothetical protein
MTKCSRTGKQRHNTEDAAQQRLNILSKRTNRERKPVRYYHCEHCLGYHLTHKPMIIKQGDIKHPEWFEKFIGKEETEL